MWKIYWNIDLSIDRVIKYHSMIELSPRQHKQYEIHATDRNIIIWLYNEIEFDVLSVTMYCTDISHNPIPLSESNYWNIIRSVVWWGSITTRYTNIHILYGNECSVFPCTLHPTEPLIGGVEYTTTPFGLSFVHPSTCEHSSCMGFALHFYFLIWMHRHDLRMRTDIVGSFFGIEGSWKWMAMNDCLLITPLWCWMVMCVTSL